MPMPLVLAETVEVVRLASHEQRVQRRIGEQIVELPAPQFVNVTQRLTHCGRRNQESWARSEMVCGGALAN